jgi:hypothetical protein
MAENGMLLKLFKLDQTLNLENSDHIRRIRKKMEKIIEYEAKQNQEHNLKLERSNSKEEINFPKEKFKALKNELTNCLVIFSLTSVNYLLMRNNSKVFNNPYTNHIFKPAFFITFFILPNFLSIYFAKLNLQKN